MTKVMRVGGLSQCANIRQRLAYISQSLAYRSMLAYGFLGGLTISSNLLVNPKYDNLTESWLKPSNGLIMLHTVR